MAWPVREQLADRDREQDDRERDREDEGGGAHRRGPAPSWVRSATIRRSTPGKLTHQLIG